MTKRDDTVSLLDIDRAARRIVRFLDGVSPEAFFVDEVRQSAVVHQLLIVGEAVKRLSPAFRSAHPDIPWSAMAGMRDQLIHAYDVVDVEEVWKTASADIPDLLRRIAPLVPRQEP